MNIHVDSDRAIACSCREIRGSIARRLTEAVLLLAGLAMTAGAGAQTADLRQIPRYKPEFHVVGGLRIAGSPLMGAIPLLIKGFEKFQPDASVSMNSMTSSEGALGMMYAGVSDIAPMGDDAKITDQMPFYNAYGYTPTEISVATGCYNTRGCLFAWAIMVNEDNPLKHLSMQQLDDIFGSQRTGAWQVGGPQHALLFTAKYARSARSNIRTWGQLGLKGRWAHQAIETYGYVAPGFAVDFERKVMHWSDKWNGNFREFVEQKEATPDADGSKVWSQRMYEAISRDKYAVGWGALMHVDGTCVNPDGSKCQSYPHIKILAICATATSPPVSLTAANVRNRSYPLSRDAYIYVNKAPGRPLDPKVREFIRFVLSREGQQIIDKQGVYSALPESDIAKQLQKID
ncbi:MAG TPA: substrate-binding domain-containing protein [Steroidobacteraceae bacterium]|nr:substrate-binding domain-containing protein [Steroidobacteraceae bacterium]